MRKIFLALMVLSFLFTACKGPSLEKANEAYDLYKFAEAAAMYEKLYSKMDTKEEKAAVAYKAADSYRRMNDYRKAESWYRRAIKLDYSDPDAYFYYAEVLKQQEDFEDALEQYKILKEKAPGDERAERGIETIELQQKWQETETRFVVEEERRLNSRNNDYAPSYMKDREILIFTSDREDGVGKKTYGWTGLQFSDLYIAEWNRRRERYDDPVILPGNVNTKFNEGASTFNERGSVMYYTQCNGKEGEEYNCKILEAKRKGKEFEVVQVLPFCTDSMVKYGHPNLSPDGKKLYFSSDMPGGYGGHDLYVSHYVSRSRTWGDPVNLGSTINTEDDEYFPFFKDDILYFASNGHIGLGGLDIFMSEFDGEDWSEPENLKPPVNTHGDDFAIVFNEEGDKGHFSSNRDGRGDDIYSFYLIPKVCALTGTVYNMKTGKPVPNAQVTLYSNKPNFSPITIETDEKGEYLFEDPFECGFNYEVDANKEEFFASRKEFVSTTDVEVSETFVRDLEIDPFPIKEIKLEGIYYGLDSARIRPASARVLDSLVQILNQNPTIVIELASHTDCRASFEHNMELSQRRADSAVQYLIKQGIDAERLQAKGYGETELLNNCACEGGSGSGLDCTEEEHQLNRRTTFRILRTDYQPKQQEITEDQLDEGTDDETEDEVPEDEMPEEEMPDEGDDMNPEDNPENN